MNNLTKKVLLLAAALVLTTTLVSVDYQISEAATINANSATIYAYDEYDSWADIYIPWDQANYQISVTGASYVSYEVVSGNSAMVNNYGQVSANTITYYKYGDYLTTVQSESEKYDDIIYRHEYGNTTIRVTADSQVFDVVVTVEDYGKIYADTVMDTYISNNYKSTMSDAETINMAASFVTNYNYDTEHSTAAGLILGQSGDCRAASDAIVLLLDKVNLKGWVRDAGEGHYNVMAMDNGGNYYLVNLGHYEWSPFEYSVTKVSSLFSYRVKEDGTITVTSYDGKDVPENVYIPDEIDGYKVTEIGDSFLKDCKTVKNVSLPNGITIIGESAFNSCSALKSINLPASLQAIGRFAFTGCTSMETFSCDGDSKYFSSSKNVLFNAEKTILYSAPSSTVLTVTATVKAVADYAAYRNSKLTTLIVMSSVESIGEGAFGSCDKLKTVTVYGVGLKKIGDYAFAMDPSLENLYIPGSVNSLGANMLYKYTGLKTLRFGGTDAQWTNIAKANDFSKINVVKNTLPYLDIDISKFYGEGIKGLYDLGIMTGLTATTFGPDVEMSRAMVVTVLYRYEGQPAITTKKSPFLDVPNDKNKWYYNSICWAKETGVAGGYGNGYFGRDDSVSRQAFIKMLYGYALSKGYDVSVKSKYSYLEAADADLVGDFAKTSVNWGYEKQLIGKGSPLNPKGKLTRAQAATILYRFIKLYS